MTNLQKWESLTESLESPQLFLHLSWYFSVAAALERRVWFGDETRPMFANMYLLLVGPPAVGKGTALREAGKLLSRFAYSDMRDPSGSKEPRPMFYVLPDTVTFEKLVFIMADITFPFTKPDGQIYPHASAYFQLEELSSLFRRQKAEDVCRFLLNMYDGVPFKYDTRHQKTAIIRNGCLNFAACTQLDFMRKAEQEGLLSEGLFSRMIIAYAEDRRHVKFHYSDLSPQQKQYREDLQNWLRALSQLYGQVTYDKETYSFLETWWQEETQYLKQFNETKLADYFARRKDQVIKLAIAHHFSEHTDLRITRSDFTFATELVRTLESGVIRIARRTGRNVNFPIQERLINYIKAKPRSHAEVLSFLAPELDMPEILNTLTLLEQSGRLTRPPANPDLWTISDIYLTGPSTSHSSNFGDVIQIP